MTRISAATSCRNSVVALALLGLACAHPSPGPRWTPLGPSCAADAPAVELPAAQRDSLGGPGPEARATSDDRWAAAARELPRGFAGGVLGGGPVGFFGGTTPRHAAPPP